MAIRKLDDLVRNYGLSTASIRIIQKFIPNTTKTQLAGALRAFAKYMLKAESSFEKRWLSFDSVVIEDFFESKVAVMRPKPFSFLLPANSYTPDFMYILEDGRHVFVEVKGSQFQHGYRDSIAKLRMAATLFYFYTFVEVMPNKEHKNGWAVRLIEPDVEYGGLFQELARQIESEQEK